MIFFDFETYCEVDLKKSGAYRYASDPSFEPLLLSWARDDEAVQLHRFDGRFDLPEDFSSAIRSGEPVVAAGQFDRIILKRLGHDLPHRQYIDIQAMSGQMGLPRSLDGCGRALGCKVEKMKSGKLSIQRFCKPYRGRRRFEQDFPELWEEFCRYAIVDTDLAREIYRRLPRLSRAEQMLYEMDCRMNDRGVRVDVVAVQTLKTVSDQLKERANQLMAEITDGAVVTCAQTAKLAAYLEIPSVSEQVLSESMPMLSGNKRKAAKLRQASSKSSVAKLDTMLYCVDPVDHRARGTLAFCGTVTKRWAGRLFQPQNFPRDCYSADKVQEFLEKAGGGYRNIAAGSKDPLTDVSRCLRGMLVPGPGKVFAVYDYSQIEARVLVWLAGQRDAVENYRRGVDQYKLMASSVFGVGVDRVTDSQRFIGKTLVLGAGYVLGGASFQANLARMGVHVELDEAKAYIAAFREKFCRLPVLWRALMQTALQVADSRNGRVAICRGRLMLRKVGSSLAIDLPSGSTLWYHQVRVEPAPAPWDGTQMIPTLKALEPKSLTRTMVGPQTLTENVCSAISRDIMARGMWRCEKARFDPVITVHDEVVLEVDDSPAERERATIEVPALLCQPPPWGPDLPLKVEGKLMCRYGK